MIWKDFSKKFRDGDHAFLGASNHSWYRYDDEKLIKVYFNRLAATRGTALHDLACKMIKLKIKPEKDGTTLSRYVSDCIDFDMQPEMKLYYSKFAYGTTDAISFENGILRVFDLKTGRLKVTFMQLYIYVALFFLSYPEISLKCIKEIELRIYQNDEVFIDRPEMDEILPIMDKIKRYSRILEEVEDEYEYGY